jgi:hypothetical protein
MSIVLQNQVEASEKSATELERQLSAAHERAMICHDVEALMESVADIFGDINHYVERWQDDPARGTPHGADGGRALFDLYVRLERTAGRTSELGRRMEAWGFALAGKQQFVTAWRKMKGIVCFSPDRVAESFAQIGRRETCTLGELADELSRDVER